MTLPPWLTPLATAAAQVRPDETGRYVVPQPGGRESAVLMLIGSGFAGAGAEEPDLLVIERSHGMRSHAGQPAFPGGALDPTDDGPVDAALREAVEETGLDRDGVEVIATLPSLYLPPSGFLVTPVLGWWRRPSQVHVVDPLEVASVHRVPVSELVDPANRLRVRHPSGYVGAAFRVRGLLIWGFTAGLTDRLLTLAGWAQPWDEGRVEDLPSDTLALAMRGRAPLETDGPPTGAAR
jgi:8-oxo-dGTP pyrophosphatase MutT (NUDIX family)